VRFLQDDVAPATTFCNCYISDLHEWEGVLHEGVRVLHLAGFGWECKYHVPTGSLKNL
jgi:hypothetical protein